MDNDQSRKLLQQIHAEINNLQTVDEKDLELLRDLDVDIQALLERSAELPVHPSVIQRMQTSLSHFEATHPNLTVLISKFLDSLSTAGV
jgi:Domain of unknown function (DUF4404)